MDDLARGSVANSCDSGCEVAVVDSDCSGCFEELETARTEAKWSADVPDCLSSSVPSDAVSVGFANTRRAGDWSCTHPAAAGFGRTDRGSDRSPAVTACRPVAYRVACRLDSTLVRSTAKLPGHLPAGGFDFARRFLHSLSD